MNGHHKRCHLQGRQVNARRVAACGAAVAAVAVAVTCAVWFTQATEADSGPTRQERECARILDRIGNGEREYADYLAADTIPSECVPEALERGLLHEEQR